MDGNNSNDRTTARVIAVTMVIASIALLALAGLTGGVGAAGGENAGGSEGEIAGALVSAASVTDSINYQGRLTDSSGSPLTETYTMTFGLYDVSTGGTALDTDAHDVDVTDGLFNTGIDFDQSYFDGGELWLGVTVGTDSEMAPRQEFKPVPYALSLVPGAVINGSVMGPVLNVTNAADDSDGVHASSAKGYGVYGKGKYGGYFTTNQGGASYNDRNAGVDATTTHDYSDGVRACTNGYGSPGVYAETTGNYSDGVRACTNGYGSTGVYTYTTGDDSYGFFTYTTGDDSYGFYATTTGYDSDGVRAYTYGDNSYGVRAKTTGDNSDGFYATTTGYDSTGVYATTTGKYSEGVYAKTTGYDSEGVHAYTTGDGSKGVYAKTTGDNSDGFYAKTYGDDSYGVYAYSDKYTAIYADTGRSDHDYAFCTDDNIYVGGKIDVRGTVDPIITECFNADPAVDYEVGDVVTLDEDSPCVKPCTEANDTKVVGVVGPTLDIEDGEISVVIMGYRGARPDEEHVNVLEMRLSNAEARMAEADLRMSGAEAESVAEKKGMENEVAMLRSEIEEAKSVTRQVVKVKVDASHAPIKRGDLLTTSPTKGHAMKAQPVDLGGVEIHRPGTLIGKAMEPLDSGTGLIEVFVTLQ